MPRSLMVLLALALSGASSPSAAEPAELHSSVHLRPYVATYSIARGRMRLGEMLAELSDNGDGTWTYRTQGRPVGLASLVRGLETDERSVFRIDGGLTALEHHYAMSGDRRNRDFSLLFDWEKMEVRGTVRGEEVVAPITAGAVDRHAMTIAVMADLVAEREFPRTHTMVDRARIRELATRIDGHEQITNSAGAFETTRVVQQRLDDETRRYIVWLAVIEDRWIPIRIQSVDDDGADFTLELARIQPST